MADDGAQFSQGTDFTAGARLDQNISQGSGFDWSGQYATVAGVGGELVEQFVARAAADDVDDLDAFGADFFQISKDGLVFEGQAFQGAANQGAFRIRHRLARFAAEVSKGSRHVRGIQEASVIGIHE